MRKGFRFYLLISTFFILSSLPSLAMEECELCNESKRLVKVKWVDPEGEESEKTMKICKGCNEDIGSYNEDKKQENERGARDLENFLTNVKYINPPQIQTIPTPTPKVPPDIQLPTNQLKEEH